MKKILFFLITIYSAAAAAQRIQNFTAFASGTNVGIRFTITKGPQCSGYTIYTSLDSVNFTQIYDYPSVCGDVNANQDISYTHTSPALNQTNYYKAEIFSPFESSPVARIYVTNQPKARMMTYPNPIVNQTDILGIKIYNTSNIHVKGFLYNQFGKPLRDYDLTTSGDIASVNVSDLANGLYVLWLTDGTQLFSSKFVVNR